MKQISIVKLARFVLGLGACACIAVYTTTAFAAAPAPTKTFRFASSGDLQSMDVNSLYEFLTINLQSNIYEGMAYINPELELTPALATKWERKAPTVWRFYLRKGVKFHEGQDFTADDVVFSVMRSKSKNSDFVGANATISKVVKVDDFTVDVHTHKPDAVIPQLMSHTYIISKKWAEEHNATEVPAIGGSQVGYTISHANGTGPFKLKSREADTKTVFEYNPDWWGEETRTHNIKEAIYTPIQSDPTRVAALVSGELDFIFPVALQDMHRIETSPQLDLLTKEELFSIFVVFNQRDDELKSSNIKGKNPFKDKRVRLAVAHALYPLGFVTKIMRGQARVSALLMGKGVKGYDASIDKGFEYNPEKAKKLLAEAGYPDGFTVEFDAPNDRYVNGETLAKAIVRFLGKVGIKAKLNVQPKAKFFPKVLGRKSDFNMFGWIPSTYDAHDSLYPLARSNGDFNMGGWNNPEYDKLVDQVQVETDEAKRNELIKKAALMVRDDVGVLPLHQQNIAWGKRKSVKITPRSDNGVYLREIVIQD